VVRGLLRLRTEVAVTPIGFISGSLWVHNVMTSSCHHKEPWSCSKEAMDVIDAAGRVGQLLAGTQWAMVEGLLTPPGRR